MVEAEVLQVVDRFGNWLVEWRKKDYSSESVYELAREVVQYIEVEFGFYGSRKKKELALKVASYIYDMANLQKHAPWIYKWIPNFIFKRIYMWGVGKAIDMAVAKLHEEGIFNR